MTVLRSGGKEFQLKETKTIGIFIKRLIKYWKDPCKKCLVKPCCSALCEPKAKHKIFWSEFRKKRGSIAEGAVIYELLITGWIIAPLFLVAWIFGFIDVDLVLPQWVIHLIDLIW